MSNTSNARVRIRPNLLETLRETRRIPTEEAQARMIGVDRTTLRRVDAGASPSSIFMAGVCYAFGLGFGEAFELVPPEEQPAQK